MPANLLIFDADYVSELNSRMNIACELMASAVSSLKGASNHENWKCKERTRILEEFDELNLKLGRLDSGVNETTRILGGSVSRYAALESQYESQAGGLADDLTNNYGFKGSAYTGGENSEGSIPYGEQPANPGASGGPAGSNPSRPGAGAGIGAGAGGAAGAGAAGAGGAGSAGHKPGGNAPGGAGSGTGAGSAGGSGGGIRIPGAGISPNRKPGKDEGNISGQESESESGAGSGSPAGAGGIGGGTMNVNLPVTHIPDNPSAAAKGIKDTQEIANVAVNSVLQTVTQALGSSSSAGSAGLDAAASRLAETYNAGKNIFDSSAAILANPSQPHTAERLKMAEGLVVLAINSDAGIAGTAGTSGAASGNFSQNAGNLSAALQSNNEASEFRNLLGAIAGQGNGRTSSSSSSGLLESLSSGSGSNSGNKSMSFFDMILEEFKKAFSGTQEGSSVSSSSVSSSGSTLAASSPVMEFLDKFIMDQAV